MTKTSKNGTKREGVADAKTVSSPSDRFRATIPEKLDRTPIETPIHAQQPPTLADYIAVLVQEHVQDENKEEFESFQEAEDFEPDLEEDFLLDMSAYPFEDSQIADPRENPQPDLHEPPASKPTDDTPNPKASESEGLEPQNHLPVTAPSASSGA